MTAMAAPPEVLGATPQSLTGPPDAGPPDGPGFQGALEDSMARTATAEGQHEKQSVSKVAGGAEAAANPAALTGVAEPAGDAAQPAASQSNETSGSGQASNTHRLHGASHLHSADAAGSKTSVVLVSQTGTTPTDSSATTAPAAATAVESQPPSDAVALAAALATANPSQTATSASTTQATQGQAAGADTEHSQSETAPQQASLTTADALDSVSQHGPVIHTSVPSRTPADAPQVSSTTPSGSVPAPDTSEVAAPTDQQNAQTNGPASTNLRLHLPWLNGGSGSNNAKVARADEVHASVTPLRQAAGQVRSTADSTAQVTQLSRSTSTGGHLSLGAQSNASTVQSTSLSQSSVTADSNAQGAETSASGATSSPFASAAPTAGAQALPFTYGANMQETIETIHATVALASRQGAAQAQISLEPAELGAVRIHLTQTGEGLVARVSAETVAGAQAIASGQSELHNTLSSLGVSLLRLDVGSFTQQQAQTGRQSPQGSGQQRNGSAPASAEAEEVASTSTVSLSPNSALIDVLA